MSVDPAGGPRTELEFVDTAEVTTAVVKAAGYPMAELRTLFDTAFSGLFPVLGQRGVHPAGPAFALYHRAPDDTVDIEVGVPIEADLGEPAELDGDFVVEQSRIPAGRVAAISHLGGYEGLGQAWDDFMAAVGSSGATPQLPFWEVYVTEPSPEADPATMRTDLFTFVE